MTDTPHTAETSHHGVVFWVALALGLALAAQGVRDFLVTYPDVTRRVSLARWIIGLDLFHDLVIAPVVLLVGLAVRRFTPATIRAPLQATLAASAVVIAIAWRPLHRSGAYKHNPTIQPLNYATATLTVLAIVWLAAAAWSAARIARVQRAKQRPPAAQP
jgi:hypothetical protein